jgi:hypothetical protein
VSLGYFGFYGHKSSYTQHVKRRLTFREILGIGAFSFQQNGGGDHMQENSHLRSTPVGEEVAAMMVSPLNDKVQ